MRSVMFAAFVVAITGDVGGRAVLQADAQEKSAPARADVRIDEDPGAEESSEEATSALRPENKPATLAIMSDEELKELLGFRLDGGMGLTFAQFGNMFLVNSRLSIGTAVGLMTDDSKVSKSELRSPFPQSYHPTLSEFLDAIALQTGSEWNYEVTGKYFKSSVKSLTPVKEMAIFEFKKAKREKPFKISLAAGWKANDKGNWVMYVPTKFPVGMDIYEMGTYSTKDEANEKAFYEGIRSSVALEWAQRVNPKARDEDLKPVQVGEYDALHYDTLLKGANKKEIHWRQWVFMVGNKCYFVVSTIIPQLEEEIYPDVQKMLQSFVAAE